MNYDFFFFFVLSVLPAEEISASLQKKNIISSSAKSDVFWADVELR